MVLFKAAKMDCLFHFNSSYREPHSANKHRRLEEWYAKVFPPIRNKRTSEGSLHGDASASAYIESQTAGQCADAVNGSSKVPRGRAMFGLRARDLSY